MVGKELLCPFQEVYCNQLKCERLNLVIFSILSFYSCNQFQSKRRTIFYSQFCRKEIVLVKKQYVKMRTHTQNTISKPGIEFNGSANY